MTERLVYNDGMNALSLSNLLLSLPIQGMLWSMLVFALCFFGVCATELIQLGWKYKNTDDAPPEKEEKAPAETPQEPIYYIVEKKKRRTKTDYGEPKPFQFKEP